MSTNLKQLEALLAHTKDARIEPTEIDGELYTARKYTVGQLPAIHEAFNSLVTGIDGVDLAQLKADDLMKYTAELSVLIANSVQLKGKSPLDFDEESFSKLLALAINTNISFFVQRVMSHIQNRNKNESKKV